VRRLLLLPVVMLTAALHGDADPCAQPFQPFIEWQGEVSGCTAFNQQQCHSGEVIAFDVRAFGAPLASCAAVEWSFGDGMTATVRAPRHLYARSGVYPVSVRVSTPTGSVVIEKQVFATGAIDERWPFAIERQARPRFYRFVVVAAEGAGDWIWDFGDGTSARGPEPVQTHFYRSGGTYTVRLSSARGSRKYELQVEVPSASRRRSSRH
jgi:PKD domain